MPTPPAMPSPSPRPQVRRTTSGQSSLYRTSSPISRGRSHSPVVVPAGSSSPRGPPSYPLSSLDRSPSSRPMTFVDQPRVPPPIYLRSSSPAGVSNKGVLKIHVPAWGVVLVRPPQRLDIHPLDSGGPEPPANDTVLTGALEVVMKERLRCQAISVGVQSVCRLMMGKGNAWEEDGVFERGVEVLGGDADGIWLEKGSQSFTFSIILPATLATHDHHEYGRVSYIITARVEGIPATTGIISRFRTSSVPGVSSDVPFYQDFDNVIARSDKLAKEHDKHDKSDGARRASFGGSFTPPLRAMHLGESPLDDSAITLGEGSPSLLGLYHRRQSVDISHLPVPSSDPHGSHRNSMSMDDAKSIRSFLSTNAAEPASRTEKNVWMKGDFVASRSLLVHANPSPSGDVTQLDLRKEGLVEGLGSWRFSASSDVFSISAVILLSIHIPNPSPITTIFFARLLMTQTYSLFSPRRPNDPPYTPEAAKNQVLYQIGRPHRSGERNPDHERESLWRGCFIGGSGSEEGWKTRAVARMPNHEKLRPSTCDGTITPIRVKHGFELQVFYSIEGETVSGAPCDGPGELRMMSVRLPIVVPSCCCTSSALDLPTYEREPTTAQTDIDQILNSPPTKQQCMCGHSFSELSETAMKRMREDTMEVREDGVGDGEAGGGSGIASGSGLGTGLGKSDSGSA